jgi:hypothetical protein
MITRTKIFGDNHQNSKLAQIIFMEEKNCQIINY